MYQNDLNSVPGVSKVFLQTGLDRCGLCTGCERVWFWTLSKWSSVSGVRHTWRVLLHLSPLLHWPLVRQALWPLWSPPQSLPPQLHLPDTLQWNRLLQMLNWWVSTTPAPHTHFSSLFEPYYTIIFTNITAKLHYFQDLFVKKKKKRDPYSRQRMIIDWSLGQWGHSEIGKPVHRNDRNIT